MNSELKLLLVAFALTLLGLILLIVGQSKCETVEYQDLQGTHTTQVCRGA